MLKEYPKFQVGEIEKIYNKLPKSEKDIIDNYMTYRISRGLGERASSDLRRQVIQTRFVIDCNFKKFDSLEQLTQLSVLISKSYLSNNMKMNFKINLANLFKYLFPDWSIRFMSLDCFSNRNKKGVNSENGKVPDSDLPTDKEIENMLKSEHKTFWKTYLVYQANTGLRTIEARTTEIKKITFNDDGTATIEIFMTKLGKPKYVFTDSQATDYIKKLIDEKKNTNTLGKYLFSGTDINMPISKMAVNKWFRKLSMKATNRYIKPYWLRHRKATQLYKLARENVISKDTALMLMGHSEAISKRYSHIPAKQEIEILKKQAFNTEISPELKNELQRQIAEQQKQIDLLTEMQKANAMQIAEMYSKFTGKNAVAGKIVNGKAVIYSQTK